MWESTIKTTKEASDVYFQGYGIAHGNSAMFQALFTLLNNEGILRREKVIESLKADFGAIKADVLSSHYGYTYRAVLKTLGET